MRTSLASRSLASRFRAPVLLTSIAALAATGATGCGSSTAGATGAGGAATTGGTTTGSSSGATSSSTSSGSGSGTGGGAAGSLSIEYPSIPVPAGGEDTRCVVLRVGNAAALHVGEIHNVLSAASHHLIIYRTNDTTEQKTPFACKPFTDITHPEKGTPLMISQKHDDLLTLPKGVAFTFQPDQMVRLEMHFINTTMGPLDASAKVTFSPVPDADFKDEADFLFFGNIDIDVPAHGTQTVGPTFIPSPPQAANAKFFGITGHTHRFGTDVVVSTAPSASGPNSSVYDVPGWSWSEPKTVYYDPPFTLPSGGGFNFTCSYANTSDASVGFGESATQEMCFFWTYYYPSQGAFVCIDTTQFGGLSFCCPGNPLCAQAFQ